MPSDRDYRVLLGGDKALNVGPQGGLGAGPSKTQFAASSIPDYSALAGNQLHKFGSFSLVAPNDVRKRHTPPQVLDGFPRRQVPARRLSIGKTAILPQSLKIVDTREAYHTPGTCLTGLSSWEKPRKSLRQGVRQSFLPSVFLVSCGETARRSCVLDSGCCSFRCSAENPGASSQLDGLEGCRRVPPLQHPSRTWQQQLGRSMWSCGGECGTCVDASPGARRSDLELQNRSGSRKKASSPIP